MKVKRISEGNLISRGHVFKNNMETVVSADVFNYLKRHFPNDFEFINEKTKEVKSNIKETDKTTKRETRSYSKKKED